MISSILLSECPAEYPLTYYPLMHNIPNGQLLLQDFKSMSDHFRLLFIKSTLFIKGLNYFLRLEVFLYFKHKFV